MNVLFVQLDQDSQDSPKPVEKDGEHVLLKGAKRALNNRSDESVQAHSRDFSCLYCREDFDERLPI